MAEAKKNEVAVKKEEIIPSVRFTQKVISQFANDVGEVKTTAFQKRLIQNYFIAVDAVLKKAEQKRASTPDKFRKKESVTWNNVNLNQLSLDVVANARIGLDPAQSNHIFPIPYHNSKTKKYDVNLMKGYRGMELRAVKYGLDVPDSIILEVVYKNDLFKPIKKGATNKVESYEFDIPEPFDRGEIIGGFYYYVFAKEPEKNKLVIFDKKAILKRKPDKASAEFWGGEKDKWVYNKTTKKNEKSGKEQVDGWYDEMVYKTLARAAYGNITIDSQKIDDDYMALKVAEDRFVSQSVEVEVEEKANTVELNITEFEEIPEVIPETKKPTPKVTQKKAEKEPEPPVEVKERTDSWDNVKNPFEDM